MRRVLLLPLLLLAACGGDETSDPVATAPGPARAGEVPPPEVRGSGGVAAPGSASLRAGDRQLLPATDGTLAAAVGEAVAGEGLLVTGTKKLGFFAGTSELQRVFVRWDGEPPAVDTVVDLEGVVREVPPTPTASLLLDPPEAAVVAAQGGLVEATAVTPAG